MSNRKKKWCFGECLEPHSKACKKCKTDPLMCDELVFAKQGLRYGIVVKDGGDSMIEIKFCPFCGGRLA